MSKPSLIKSEKRVAEQGEVFTPDRIVEDMLDDFGPEAWTDPTGTFLEPSCGNGNFLVAIMNRLMVGLEAWEPNAEARHRHIIEKMLFGVDIMEDNVTECVKRLGAENWDHNIVCFDGLLYDYQFGQSKKEGLFEFAGHKSGQKMSNGKKPKKHKIKADDVMDLSNL